MILCNLFSTFFSLVQIPSMHIFLSRYCSSVHFTLIYCNSLFVHPDSNRTVKMATQEDSRKHLPTAIDDLITGFDPKKLKHADLLEKNPLPSKEGWWIIFPHISFNLWVGLWLTFFLSLSTSSSSISVAVEAFHVLFQSVHPPQFTSAHGAGSFNFQEYLGKILPEHHE